MNRSSRKGGLISWCLAISIILVSVTHVTFVRAESPTNGLIMLIEFEKIEGVRHWERELDQHGFTALIQAQYNVLKDYPKDFERLANKGYPIAGPICRKTVLGRPL